MNEHSDSRHYVRRVVLPSGKTIEVVYFEEHPAVTGTAQVPEVEQIAPAIEPSERSDLHVCGSCNSELVYPLDWEEAGATHWEVTLRCPNCEWSGTGVFEQSTVESFDEELDRGTEALVGDLRRLMAANMEEEIERFVHALDADALLPEDFGRPASA
ncbi:MAG: hypothetical protein ACJ762_10735 [Solirubrobacteraceae bacterium]